MNTEVLFSSKSEMWETPQDFFDKLDEEFHFDLDVCAIPENAKCKRYYTPEMDGLSRPWEGVCWCNPPYGREISAWVRRAWRASVAGNTVVMLLPARTDTVWFHEWILGKAEIRFIRGRLKFGGSKNSAPFPSMVVVFRQKEANTVHKKLAEYYRSAAKRWEHGEQLLLSGELRIGDALRKAADAIEALIEERDAIMRDADRCGTCLHAKECRFNKLRREDCEQSDRGHWKWMGQQKGG